MLYSRATIEPWVRMLPISVTRPFAWENRLGPGGRGHRTHEDGARLHLREIGWGHDEALGRCQSSVSRGLSRNRGFRGHRDKQANGKARQRHAVKPKAVKMTTAMKSGVGILAEGGLEPRAERRTPETTRPENHLP
jgi:hypothetical protein